MGTIRALCEIKEKALENIVCEMIEFCLGLNVLRFVVFPKVTAASHMRVLLLYHWLAIYNGILVPLKGFTRNHFQLNTCTLPIYIHSRPMNGFWYRNIGVDGQSALFANHISIQCLSTIFPQDTRIMLNFHHSIMISQYVITLKKPCINIDVFFNDLREARQSWSKQKKKS